MIGEDADRRHVILVTRSVIKQTEGNLGAVA